MRHALTRVLAQFPCWEVRCPACALPGRRGYRTEVALLTGLHNDLLHRGHPVAAARIGLVSR
jgi:hypothetical protein